jgi:putative peptidoglycan lipid II flippase
VAGGIVLVIALAVMMGTARGPLAAALRALRSADAGAPDRQEVPGG